MYLVKCLQAKVILQLIVPISFVLGRSIKQAFVPRFEPR